MKIKVSADTIEGAQEVRAAQNGLQSFSKAVELGHDYRLFLLVSPESIKRGKPSILSASFPVRSLDRFVKGSMYILEDWDTDDMTGRYIDKTPLAPYERIARVIHKAEYARARKIKERNMKNDAVDAGEDITKEAFISRLAIELNKVNLQYNGDKETSTYATVKPLVGPVRTYTCIEMYIVPTEGGVPDFTKAIMVAYNVSSSIKLQKLINAFKSAYKPGESYVELSIQYGYKAKDHAEAGRALTFEAVKDEDRLAAKTPEKFAEFEPHLDELSKTAEQIAARSMAARYNQPAASLIASLKEYVSKTPNLFHNLDFEDNTVKYAAQELLDSGIVIEKSVQEKLLAIARENSGMGEDILAEEETTEDFDAAVVSKAETLDELAEAVIETSSTGELSAMDSGDISEI